MKKAFLICSIILLPFLLIAQDYAISPLKWKKKADAEYSIFEKERKKEMTKEFTNENANEEVMYKALLGAFYNYVQTDEHSQSLEDKGWGSNFYVKDISEKLLDIRTYFINAGVYYNDKAEYSKASEYFEIYSRYPKLRIFTDERVESIESDSTNVVIGYYAIITAIQSENKERSIYLLSNAILDPYISNSIYIEGDLYELLANEYRKSDDTQKYIEILEVSTEKFPKHPYFFPNLINEYIQSGNSEGAFRYLDLLIKKYPEEACNYLNIKATIYTSILEYTEAEKLYLQALKKDKECEKSLEGIGVLYILQAQDINEETNRSHKRKEQVILDKQTEKLYEKAIPHLEKLYALQILRDSNEYDEIRPTLLKLQNVYYNLSMLGLNYKKELDDIDSKLKSD